jgi:hypothetical protein
MIHNINQKYCEMHLVKQEQKYLLLFTEPLHVLSGLLNANTIVPQYLRGIYFSPISTYQNVGVQVPYIKKHDICTYLCLSSCIL